jgi:hypothetical protein
MKIIACLRNPDSTGQHKRIELAMACAVTFTGRMLFAPVPPA